jgi:outer membrane protein assembly factor BamE (lipoprotein component of BamABCDE complex)
MQMRARRSLALAGVIAAVLAVGCSPVVRNHGYAPPPEELAELRVGLDTRATVQSKIGRPAGTGIFTDDGWYYVSSRVEHLTYHAPEVVDRRVVALLFDQNDVLASVNEYGLEDGRVVDLETRTTPTHGRQLTILEQAFGNIGVITEDTLTGEN